MCFLNSVSAMATHMHRSSNETDDSLMNPFDYVSAVLLVCQKQSCDMNPDEATATSTASDAGAKDDLKQKRLDDLKQLKEKFAKGM